MQKLPKNKKKCKKCKKMPNCQIGKNCQKMPFLLKIAKVGGRDFPEGQIETGWKLPGLHDRVPYRSIDEANDLRMQNCEREDKFMVQ